MEKNINIHTAEFEKPKTFFYYQEKEVVYHNKKEIRRVTIAGIIVDNNLLFGRAECSIKDQFTKKKGKAIATGRANKKPIETLNKVEINKGIGKLFVDTAKKLI